MHTLIGFDPLAAKDGRRLSAPVDVQSRAVLRAEPTGLFPDGWVRAHAGFSFLTLDAVGSLSVEVWSPEADAPLSLTLKTAGAEEVTLVVPSGRLSVLQFPLKAAPHSEIFVELLADCERQLSASDTRRAAYRLRCIGAH